MEHKVIHPPYMCAFEYELKIFEILLKFQQIAGNPFKRRVLKYFKQISKSIQQITRSTIILLILAQCVGRVKTICLHWSKMKIIKRCTTNEMPPLTSPVKQFIRQQSSIKVVAHNTQYSTLGLAMWPLTLYGCICLISPGVAKRTILPCRGSIVAEQ